MCKYIYILYTECYISSTFAVFVGFRFCCPFVVIPFLSCYSPATRAVCQVPKKVVQEVEQPIYRPVPHMAGGPGVSPEGVSPTEFHRSNVLPGQTTCGERDPSAEAIFTDPGGCPAGWGC